MRPESMTEWEQAEWRRMSAESEARAQAYAARKESAAHVLATLPVVCAALCVVVVVDVLNPATPASRASEGGVK